MKKLFVFLTSLALVTLPLLLAGPDAALAQGPEPPACPASVETPNAVFVRDNYAYIGVGPRLVVLNISNPAVSRVGGPEQPVGWRCTGHPHRRRLCLHCRCAG